MDGLFGKVFGSMILGFIALVVVLTIAEHSLPIALGVAGGLVLLVIVIVLLSGGGNSARDDY